MYQIILTLHIVFGGLVLISGLGAAFFAKGSRKHMNSGRLFSFTMIASALMALVLTVLKFNPFLQAIGLFTLYMTLVGLFAFKKNSWIKILPFTGLAIGIYLLYVGVFAGVGLSIVSIVFGVFQTLIALQDAFKPIKNKAVLHGSRIGGALIAASTAFVVTALNFVPWYVGWFLPSVVGSILLTRGLRRFINKTSSKAFA